MSRVTVREIQKTLEDVMKLLDKYEKIDTRYSDWYVSAKEYILQADNDLSFIIND